ncbi:MAG: porin [Candidatus Saccharicenans sp.]
MKEARQRVFACLLTIPLLACFAPIVSGYSTPVDSESSSPAITSSLPVSLSGYTQILFSGRKDSADTFSVRRARLSMGASIIKNLHFKLQVDFSRSPSLLDAMAEVNITRGINFRLGQFLVPFSLENSTSAGQLLTINRSQVVEKLAPGRDTGTAGRDIGAVAYGSYSSVHYAIGLVNGTGANKKDDNDHKDLVARIAFKPIEGFSLGVSIYNGRRFSTAAAMDLKRNRYGFDLTWLLAPFYLQAEYIMAKDHTTEKSGWYILGAADLIKKKYQLVLRLDYLNDNHNIPGNSATTFTAGTTWFLSATSKAQVNVEFHRVENGPDYNAFLLQLQVGL